MLLSAGERLGPYQILAPIGAGGMGEVWKARDTRLNRIVAIKRLNGEHAACFKQEAHAIAALNHPNICQLYDVGDDYLVMEYVEGAPLKGPLPESQMIACALQIAAALEEAHSHGIVHRDLKPANILVTAKGSAKLLDFGLAQVASPMAVSDTSDTISVDGLTQPSGIVGTIAYMSPEQAQGLPCDARSDVFSLGIVLYELLAGRRPFSGDTPVALFSSILKDQPLALLSAPALDQIIQKCLAKRAEDRYQSMAEIKTALDQAAAKRVETQPSIAVLPFTNMSGDKENDYFSDGLAEEILNLLAKIPGLKVIARTSSFAFRGTEQDVRKIAETLGVSHVLEGSVRRAGSHLRVTAQLIHAVDGTHLWSERYDRDMTDVFAIQDEISLSILQTIKGKLATAAPAARGTQNLEASQMLWRGRYHVAQATKESLGLAVKEFKQSCDLDPMYAEPHAELAAFYHVLAYFHLAPAREVAPLARKEALAALELDPSLDAANEVLAGTYLILDYNWLEADKIFTRLLSKPNASSRTKHRYAYQYLTALGRHEEAIKLNRQAVAEDPLSPLSQAALGFCLYYARRFEECLEVTGGGLTGGGEFWLLDLASGMSLMALGRTGEALDHLRRARLRGPAPGYLLGLMGLCLKRLGDLEASARLWEEEIDKNACAEAFFRMDDGDTEVLMDLLHQQITDRFPNSSKIGVDPLWNGHRSHPRFAQGLRRMNLSPDVHPLPAPPVRTSSG